MNVSQSFRLALKSLMVSKVRALLTMLGIIIGVAAVIVIVSLGNGMQQYMNSQFEQIGVNLIQVAIYSYGGNREVEPDDMYALAEKYPSTLTPSAPTSAPPPPCAAAPTNTITPACTASVRPLQRRKGPDGQRRPA